MNLVATQGVPAGRTSKLWVLVVLLVGAALGGLLSLFLPEPEHFGHFRYVPFSLEPLLQFHILLSTIQISLLVALVIVYFRVYRATRANFALGLVIVLVALMLQSLLSHPILVGLVGDIALGPVVLVPSADILTIVAYTIFLYLSLE